MNYRFEYETIINEYKNINSFIPILLLRWINMNHYVLLFPVNYLEYLLLHNNYTVFYIFLPPYQKISSKIAKRGKTTQKI